MHTPYSELLKQRHAFPRDGFGVHQGRLRFHGVDLGELIERHGTPLRLMYLPKIGEQIGAARERFAAAMRKRDYSGRYCFCYCTKSNHLFPVVDTALKNGAHLETSSAFDLDLIDHLHRAGRLPPDCEFVHNGHKSDAYLSKILELQDAGLKRSLIVLDSRQELGRLRGLAGEREIRIGVRMATQDSEAGGSSRLGIRASELIDFYEREIAPRPELRLGMFHFFVDAGITDSTQYWDEFERGLEQFVQLRTRCDGLSALNIGGGLPIPSSLEFAFDYDTVIEKIVTKIQRRCRDAQIPEPDIYTEFGKYTVGEAGALIFQVLEEKQQNEGERWYLLDNSLINTIPDAWAIDEDFIVLPINKWQRPGVAVKLGGISCDRSDHYAAAEARHRPLLPALDDGDPEPLYLGVFHTGAYQDAISGYGGLQHCLVPAPKYVLIDRDAQGRLIETVCREAPSAEAMLSTLGYNGASH